MPTQPYSALKCWPSAFCPASGFHLPYHFRSLNREVWQRSLFCSPVGADVRQPSWHQPYRSADLCSVSTVCVSDSQWVWNLVEHTIPATVPYQGWAPGGDGGEHCGYEGLYTPASQTSRWTCLSCCQKGHFIRGINSELKGTTWKFRRIRLTQLVPLSFLKPLTQLNYCKGKLSLISLTPGDPPAYLLSTGTCKPKTIKHVLGYTKLSSKGWFM